ncbi:MAG: hypothetical protein F3745_00865 [Nitrospinae bacterium]|nr:hypothetical protein [Nitrospinota bacterium]
MKDENLSNKINKKRQYTMSCQYTDRAASFEVEKIKFIFFLLVISIIQVGVHPVWSAEAPKKRNLPKVYLNKNGISASGECGKCHKDIYATWKNSLHSQVKGNAVFWTAYLQAYYDDAEKAQELCLSCHSPVAIINKDLMLTKKISGEGVNCDFCHSISGVQKIRSQFEYEHKFGLLKQGPLKDLESPVHETKFNKLFKQSQLCAKCHEYESDNGLKIIETYSEWEQGPYSKKGTHCQDCHMRKVKGKIVATEIAITPEKKIRSHDIAGGHSLAMRDKSLDVQISSIDRIKQKLVVNVDVINKGVGHKIPTGLPSKKLTLKVVAQSSSGSIYKTKKKVYQKKLVDRNGDPVVKDSDLMLGKAVRIVSDNRISPKETRREEFTFFLPEEDSVKISATVFYSHNPEIVEEVPINIKMNEVSKWTGE